MTTQSTAAPTFRFISSGATLARGGALLLLCAALTGAFLADVGRAPRPHAAAPAAVAADAAASRPCAS